ncbi:low-specificity L-threonine aldolase [Legionella sp. km772]|uniref:low-specificity L-threonine aldolase n=1 Tax=Legionella sp. km772 TaxID=2498111 RepID=UPI000F8DDD0E|nr:low-specificity L-threonine aldolase [Legionella sp. km772]RUR12722.1 low-specificity L-threonine aldolase [Legionella sp. km772]
MSDFRSDTVTKPSKAMLDYLTQAKLGDDVFGDDPSVLELEEMMASYAGMEAAVFAPSGTMTNLMGIMAHCQRGDEYIVGQTAHTYMWEGGGAAVLGSIQPQPLDFAENGCLDLQKVDMAIKPTDDHHPRTKLLCLENTMNGKVLPLDYLNQIKPFCRERKLAAHLDGARVYHACVKLGVSLETIAQHFDSISICLSKGLGAPIGSLLCGSKALIKEARHWRKMLGGGMRQAGLLAAAGIYALNNNIERLAEDHEHAQYLAAELSTFPEISVDFNSLQTNILFIKVEGDYPALQHYLAGQGILLPKQANKKGMVRLVTHLDIGKEDIKKLISTLKIFYHHPSHH